MVKSGPLLNIVENELLSTSASYSTSSPPLVLEAISRVISLLKLTKTLIIARLLLRSIFSIMSLESDLYIRGKEETKL